MTHKVNQKIRPYARKCFFVIRQLYAGDPMVKSAPMTEKQAIDGVLHFRRLGYHFADYKKIEA